jgi:glycosyltransferase involved in cell wall biosynthesis
MALRRLLIASTKLPPLSGGAELVAWETARRLTTSYEVHILTVGKAKASTKENVQIHYAPPSRPYTLLYSTILRPRVFAPFSEVSPDILHTHQTLPWAYVFAKAKCVKIVTCHGMESKQSYLYRFLTKRALENADIVTAPSKSFGEYVERNYDIVCRTLPNGVDTNFFAPRNGVRSRSDVILFVGRIIPQKGIRELIKAARALPEYEFWLVGDPETKRVQIPHLSNIREMGFVDDIVNCYNKATLCVFPSVWENFPLVGLEAMACGRTIVASRSGFSEYVDNGRDGILVEHDRPDELIESIKYLMENGSERERLERNAREKALQYDWGVIMERYRALYEGLL